MILMTPSNDLILVKGALLFCVMGNYSKYIFLCEDQTGKGSSVSIVGALYLSGAAVTVLVHALPMVRERLGMGWYTYSSMYRTTVLDLGRKATNVAGAFSAALRVRDQRPLSMLPEGPF